LRLARTGRTDDHRNVEWIKQGNRLDSSGHSASSMAPIGALAYSTPAAVTEPHVQQSMLGRLMI
jgi:hypothetical protein